MSDLSLARTLRLRGPAAAIKRLLPRTLFGRSLVIIVTPVVLAQLVATWIFYDRHWDTMTNRLAWSVVGDIALVIEQLQRDRSEVERAGTLDMMARHTDLLISREPGTELADPPTTLDTLLEAALAQAIEDRIGWPYRIDTAVAPKWVEIRIQMPDGVLTVMSPQRRLYSPTTYIFLLWMVGSALVLFAIAIVFMRNQIRPIRRLAIAADSFGKGIDLPNFKLEGAAEVRQAAAAFLVMRERIRRQMTQRTEMLAGVSHDLRTPLTRMKLQLAMLGDGPDIEELRADVVEMERMVEGYLAFARGEGTEVARPTDLTALLHEVAGATRREGVEVDLRAQEGLVLPLRPMAFRRCLTNLLANARRYAPHVWVQAGRAGNAVEITIDDDGPGIPENAREDVFKPFFRLESSRNPETGGAGLGLTIARDIVHGHGGDIRLADSPRGGLRVILRVPI